MCVEMFELHTFFVFPPAAGECQPAWVVIPLPCARAPGGGQLRLGYH